jgi:hydrogenase expression/formation protein HypC
MKKNRRVSRNRTLVADRRSRTVCVAVPAKVVRINSGMAVVDVEGVRRDVSLLLLDGTEVGDYVIVHAGFAIQKLDEQEALTTLELLREIGAMREGSDP